MLPLSYSPLLPIGSNWFHLVLHSAHHQHQFFGCFHHPRRRRDSPSAAVGVPSAVQVVDPELEAIPITITEVRASPDL